MEIERILQFGYYPVSACCVGDGAQIVNGQWYMPRWGCDTLQYIIDEMSPNPPLHADKKRRCHVCSVEVGEVHKDFCSVGNNVFCG